MPRIIPAGSWKKGVEDGQREPQHRRQLVALADMGYHGAPRGGGGRKDDDGEDQGGRRSWKDTLLGRSRAGKEVADQEGASRRRSRSPLGSVAPRARGAAATQAAAMLRARGPLYSRHRIPCPRRRPLKLHQSLTRSPTSSPAPRTISRSHPPSTAWLLSWRPTWRLWSRPL